ncbi:MAG: hypothetical protein QXY08_07015 [Nitrososphaerales archaeon]
MDAASFIIKVRKELSEENKKILEHPFIKDAEAGKLCEDKIKCFTTQQDYIISHDLRSLALMLTRSKHQDETDFFHPLIQGDIEALKRLHIFAEELGLKIEDFTTQQLIPEAVSYTHYLAWLALYANAGEQAAALIVNLPVWGEACRRFGSALKEKYGYKKLDFFELFLQPFDAVEAAAFKVINRYIERFSITMERCVKMIQRYELMFWDGIYRLV